MNARTTDFAECERLAESRTARESTPSSPGDGMPDPAWLLEDLEEPETWTLASFEDLLRHELV